MHGMWEDLGRSYRDAECGVRDAECQGFRSTTAVPGNHRPSRAAWLVATMAKVSSSARRPSLSRRVTSGPSDPRSAPSVYRLEAHYDYEDDLRENLNSRVELTGNVQTIPVHASGDARPSTRRHKRSRNATPRQSNRHDRHEGVPGNCCRQARRVWMRRFSPLGARLPPTLPNESHSPWGDPCALSSTP